MNVPQTSEGSQFCGSCKRDLPLESFSPGNRGKRGTWCRECFAAYNKGRRPHVKHGPIPCDYCGKEFVPKQVKPGQRRYCSNTCKANAAYWRNNPREQGECKVCGADITHMRRDARYCSDECMKEQRRRDGRGKAIRRKSLLLRRYGLTQEAFDELLAEQGGGCAICGSADPKSNHGQWHIDHDHACCSSHTEHTCGSCVRGLLCGPCNLAIGLLEDDPERLESAARYLRNQ